MPPPDSAQPPFHRNTQFPEPTQAAADGGVEADQRRREAAERQREPDEEEAHEPEAEDGEVRADHVGGVLGPAEAGLDEGEAGLHEDDQDRTDHHPQQVHLRAEERDGLERVRVLGAGRRHHPQRGEQGHRRRDENAGAPPQRTRGLCARRAARSPSPLMPLRTEPLTHPVPPSAAASKPASQMASDGREPVFPACGTGVNGR